MTPSADDLADAIAADWRWAQRLARGLLRDPLLADDACQEAWCAAQRRFRGWRPPRAWLGEAVRRIARGVQRAAGRRRRVLERLPPAPPAPTTDELVARSETCQRLAAWLLALPDPVRTTALLHFQHGCTVAEIAARLACPEDTVRWRLRRAVELLRARCARELGPDWPAALGAVAFVAVPGPRAAAALSVRAPALPALLLGGSLLVNTKTILGAASVAVLAAWWLAVTPAERTQPPAPAAHADPAAVAAAPPAAAPAPGAALPAAGDAHERALVAASSGVDGFAHGTLTWVDERGVEHDRGTGTAEILAQYAGEVSVKDVEVEAGRWRLPLPGWPERLELRHAVVDGRWTTPAVAVLAASPQPIALRVRALPELALRVLGEDTGADVADVTVVADESGSHDFHPASAHTYTVVARSARSPLRVPSTRPGATQWFYVGAPGYAWNTIELALDEPAERTVRLVRGGGVTVHVEGEVPDKAVLRVRGPLPARRCVVEIGPAPAGPFPISGLPCGRWLVTLDVGFWTAHADQAASAEVEVEAGRTVDVVLRVPARAAATRAPVPVTGTLHVPPAWRDVRRLVIEASGRTKAAFPGWRRVELAAMTRDPDGAYRWDAGELPPGDYQAVVSGPDWRTRFRVVAGQPVALRMPDPCAVRVRVVDRDSGRVLTAPAKRASWHSVMADWNSMVECVRVEPDADGWHRFQAPPGRIEFAATPEGFLPACGGLDVGAGDNVLILETRRAGGLDVVLLDGGVRLPWPDSMRCDVVDARGASVLAEMTEGRLGVREVGKVRLRLSAIDGYLPVDPVEAEVALGEWTRVEVALRRRP